MQQNEVFTRRRLLDNITHNKHLIKCLLIMSTGLMHTTKLLLTDFLAIRHEQ